jgi:hypothetical protein
MVIFSQFWPLLKQASFLRQLGSRKKWLLPISSNPNLTYLGLSNNVKFSNVFEKLTVGSEQGTKTQTATH